MIDEIDLEVLKLLPKSFQVFYAYVKEVQEGCNGHKIQSKKKKGGKT